MAGQHFEQQIATQAMAQEVQDSGASEVTVQIAGSTGQSTDPAHEALAVPPAKKRLLPKIAIALVLVLLVAIGWYFFAMAASKAKSDAARANNCQTAAENSHARGTTCRPKKSDRLSYPRSGEWNLLAQVISGLAGLSSW